MSAWTNNAQDDLQEAKKTTKNGVRSVLDALDEAVSDLKTRLDKES